MNLRRFYIARGIGFLILLFLVFIWFAFFKTDKQSNQNKSVNNINVSTSENSTKDVVAEIVDQPIEPVDEFYSRISKKPFGIYITPQTSPVQPEKFTGYHTGVDVEYEDSGDEEVVIRAISDGIVVRSAWVSGYGGMLAILHKDYIVIYGHLNPATLPDINKKVFKGDNIAILGKGYSNETDGERKHLHFAIYTGPDINARGYVATKTELGKWVDPVEFFKQ